MDQDMQQYLDKAEVLIEALTYIQRFNRKIIVVKYGGSAMLDEELQKNVIKDVTFLKLVGFKPIIVHGGGKEISKWVSKAGMEPKFIDVAVKRYIELKGAASDVYVERDGRKIAYDDVPKPEEE